MARNQISVEELIKRAVEAGSRSASQKVKDAYKATERRLYGLPILRQKMEDDQERLEDMKRNGLAQRSKSIVRFSKSGVRLSPEEILEAVVADLEANIAADEYEIQIMERALKTIAKDNYYLTVTGKYFDHLTDEQVAELIPCDTSTVWRNRKRLVQRLSVWLYGVAAIG